MSVIRLFPEQESFMHRLGGLEKDCLLPVPYQPIGQSPKNDGYATSKAKIDYIANEIPELEILGNPEADLLVVGWGGTYGHLYSAVESMNAIGKKVAMVHFNYINPMPKNTEEILRRYKKVVVCELNNGQFATQLCAKIPGLTNVSRFNKVQGQPFMVSELTDHFSKLMEE